MFSTLKTLFDGSTARAEYRLKDAYAVELIDQKIREAESNLVAAKTTLASLIQRSRSERRLYEALDGRIASLTERAGEALQKDREDLAREAATAIADLENEREGRRTTMERLDGRVMQLQTSVETAHRRIVDLKQGAITARAIRREQGVQARLGRTTAGASAADEAESLIARVVSDDDPFEQGAILADIDRGLSHGDVESRMADAGIGAPDKSTAAAVLARLKSKS